MNRHKISWANWSFHSPANESSAALNPTAKISGPWQPNRPQPLRQMDQIKIQCGLNNRKLPYSDCAAIAKVRKSDESLSAIVAPGS